MGLHDSFDILSDIVGQFDARDRSVRSVDVTTETERGDALAVTMQVPVSLCAASSEGVDSSLEPQRAALDGTGGLTVTVSVADLLPDLAATESVVDIDEQAVHVEDSELIMTVSFGIEPRVSTARDPGVNGADEHEEHGEGVGDPAAESLEARLSATRSDDVPPYEDTGYLSCLYESCGTFTEMSEHIEMDVAAETVRRYMIEAGIHDPDSYDTAAQESGTDDESGAATEDRTGDADDRQAAVSDAEPARSAPEPVPEEQFVTDGLGLPEGVAVEDIVDAVVDSTAVYEVERALDLDRGEARDLLRQLNVLDLVLQRLDGPRQDVSKNDVVRRIRQCATGDA